MNPKSTPPDSTNPYDLSSEIVSPSPTSPPETCEVRWDGSTLSITPSGGPRRTAPTPPSRYRKDGVAYCSVPTYDDRQCTEYLRAIGKLDFAQIELFGPRPVALRLSVPTGLPARQWKQAFKKVWGLLRRTKLPIWMFWRLEPHQNWEPHFHFVIGGIPEDRQEPLMKKLKTNWCLWTGQHTNGEPDHVFLTHGTWHEPVNTTAGAAYYQTKHVTAHHENQLGESRATPPPSWIGGGRSWGKCGTKHVPRSPHSSGMGSKEQGLAWKRAVYLLRHFKKGHYTARIADLDNGKRLTYVVKPEDEKAFHQLLDFCLANPVPGTLVVFKTVLAGIPRRMNRKPTAPAHTPPTQPPTTPPSPTLSPDDHDHPSDH